MNATSMEYAIDLYGNRNPLMKILAAGQISHAYLFIGDKEAVIDMGLWFARALNCERQEAGEGVSSLGAPCEACDSCRKALHGNHSGIHHITAANGKQYISIEQIRTMQQQAYLANLEGNYQVFLLCAEQLREEGANSLLKVLEEPPAQTVFLLYAQKDLDILPTILSRCQVVRLQEGEAETLGETLEKAGQWLGDISNLSADRLLSWGERWEKDKQGLRVFLLAVLQVLHGHITDAVREAGGQPEENLLVPLLESAALVEQTIEGLDKNVNQRLLIDVMVLKLKRLIG